MGFNFGLKPNTSVGYLLESIDESTDPVTNNRYDGNGGINSAFVGVGFELFKNLGLGISSSYSFGNLNHYHSKILTDVEQKVMESFIKSGKGFVGVHSAADTEYNWQWYGKLVGAYYRNHTEVMNGKILTINHEITNHLESEWEIEDEWYNFDYVNYDINILLNLDECSYIGGEHPDYHPITWYHEYDGGRSFYTGLGHTKEVYDDEKFIKLLEKGILYASYEDY